MRRRFEPEPAGAMLQTEFLDDYELTAKELAEAIRVPIERVERLLAGVDPLDADLALRLAKLFGGQADGWLYWQRARDLWRAREPIVEDLEAIVPLDPDSRLSVREDEPLEPELVEELKRRMADYDDPRRWVIVSRILDEDVPLYERDIGRSFYDVATGCYTLDLLHATPFKKREIAEATAAVLGDRQHVVEITREDLKKPAHDDEVDREVRDCLLKNSGRGMSAWDAGTYLRDNDDMAAYLEAAAKNGDGGVIAVAVADVLRAMTAKTTVEYLRATGQIRE
ncbi:MAG: HigA family addiction module antitoxin [Coriobacteriia bacterium]|nr:HigA family addiction module antitoxin [Coriobacteriia bacterium]